MFQHILVPLDQSSYAERALEYAQNLSRSLGSRVSLVTVVEELDGEDSPELQRARDIRTRRAELYLEKRTAEQRQAGLAGVDSHLRSGEPADAIVDLARALGADLIAMSTHGVGARRRYALGSVAQKVLQSAPCPVLVVRIAEETPGAD